MCAVVNVFNPIYSIARTAYCTDAVTLTRNGAEFLQELKHEIFPSTKLTELDKLDVARVSRHLTQLVELYVATNGNWNDLDAVVLHDVGLDDSSCQVVRSTVDEQQHRLESIVTRSCGLELDVRRFQTLHHCIHVATSLY